MMMMMYGPYWQRNYSDYSRASAREVVVELLPDGEEGEPVGVGLIIVVTFSQFQGAEVCCLGKVGA